MSVLLSLYYLTKFKNMSFNIFFFFVFFFGILTYQEMEAVAKMSMPKCKL